MSAPRVHKLRTYHPNQRENFTCVTIYSKYHLNNILTLYAPLYTALVYQGLYATTKKKLNKLMTINQCTRRSYWMMPSTIWKRCVERGTKRYPLPHHKNSGYYLIHPCNKPYIYLQLYYLEGYTKGTERLTGATPNWKFLEGNVFVKLQSHKEQYAIFIIISHEYGISYTLELIPHLKIFLLKNPWCQ